MFKFKFGLIWTAFVSPIFIICLVIPAEQRNGVPMSLSLFIFFLLFEFVGLYMIISGLKEIVKNLKTEKYGSECYGIIRNILETGAYANNSPEYKVLIDFVNPETYQVESLEEIIGFDYYEYPVNSYVLCKHYQNDINIEEIIYNNAQIPEYAKIRLQPKPIPANTDDVKFSQDGEYAIIDGIKYKKMEDKTC